MRSRTSPFGFSAAVCDRFLLSVFSHKQRSLFGFSSAFCDRLLLSVFSHQAEESPGETIHTYHSRLSRQRVAFPLVGYYVDQDVDDKDAADRYRMTAAASTAPTAASIYSSRTDRPPAYATTKGETNYGLVPTRIATL